MNAIYSAICIDCPPELQELTMLDGTMDFNTKLARNHNKSEGHTCYVLEEPSPIFVNGKQINMGSGNSRRVIRTFMS